MALPAPMVDHAQVQLIQISPSTNIDRRQSIIAVSIPSQLHCTTLYATLHEHEHQGRDGMGWDVCNTALSIIGTDTDTGHGREEIICRS